MFIIILTARHKGYLSDFAFEHIAPLFKERRILIGLD
jgi:hypothetical protein